MFQMNEIYILRNPNFAYDLYLTQQKIC